MSEHRPQNWFSFYVRGMITVACLVLGATSSVFAQQPVSFGIKTGVPITGSLQTTGATYWQGYSFPSSTRTPHYAIGPVVDIRLPGRYSLEAGVMYKGIVQQAPDVTLTDLILCVDPPYCENEKAIFQTQVVSKVARSWEFPIALQYHFALRSLEPYVEGGYSYNHISGIFVKPVGAFYNQQAPLPQHVEWPNASTMNRRGFLFGGGVEMKLPLFRVTPGIRYARYDIVEKIGPQQFGPFVSRSQVEGPYALDFTLGFNLNQKAHWRR